MWFLSCHKMAMCVCGITVVCYRCLHGLAQRTCGRTTIVRLFNRLALPSSLCAESDGRMSSDFPFPSQASQFEILCPFLFEMHLRSKFLSIFKTLFFKTYHLKPSELFHSLLYSSCSPTKCHPSANAYVSLLLTSTSFVIFHVRHTKLIDIQRNVVYKFFFFYCYF